MIIPFKKVPRVAVLPYKCSDLDGGFPSMNEMHSGSVKKRGNFKMRSFLYCLCFTRTLFYAFHSQPLNHIKWWWHRVVQYIYIQDPTNDRLKSVFADTLKLRLYFEIINIMTQYVQCAQYYRQVSQRCLFFTL